MRIGIIGTGGVARRHLGVLCQMEDVEVVGHVSADHARVAAQAVEWGGRACTRLVDLLDRDRPDAVWVCVTPDRHGPLEHTLIARGIPFFVEKPLAVDLGTAETIARALNESGCLVAAVGYKFRALDTLPRVRELLEERPPRMVLAVWHDSLPAPVWWRRGERSGGQVVEQATHLLDLARALVGDAEVLHALGGRWSRADAPGSDVPDVSAAFLRFATNEGPVPGMLSATSLLRGHGPIELQLVCEGRVLRISEQRLLVDSGQSIEEFATDADPFVVEDRAFIDAVLQRDANRVVCSYRDALESHRLACAVRDAMDRASARGATDLPGRP
ncbi:MAG TPA: Gfo/Idh/MocA family oxidoreductase [Chloroflexota bacterium]